MFTDFTDIKGPEGVELYPLHLLSFVLLPVIEFCPF